jgi:excisionase family DNA binding protein
MATTKTKAGKTPAKRSAGKNGVPETVESTEVLTLAEAAAYLRVSQDDVERMVREQDLPGRFVGDSWRFLKPALRDWLACPMPRPSKEAARSTIGSWKDDPDLDEMLKEIYKQRGRPMIEEEK